MVGLVDQHPVPVDDIDLGMSLEIASHVRERARQQQGIGSDRGEDVAGRVLEAEIEGDRGLAVGVSLAVGELALVPLQDLGGLAGGGGVLDDVLEPLVILIEHAS